jgi:tripartite motif-containing protein 71
MTQSNLTFPKYEPGHERPTTPRRQVMPGALTRSGVLPVSEVLPRNIPVPRVRGLPPKGGRGSKQKNDVHLRLMLSFLLAILLLILAGLSVLFLRYILRPEPLPELLPVPVKLDYPPHYLFSIYDLDKPVGVTLSPHGSRIYVSESGGERMIKVFSRDGNQLGAFAPPGTSAADRSPLYLATDQGSRVFVSDVLQHAIFVYDQDGKYLDTILGPDLTLSGYVSVHEGGLQPGVTFAYNAFQSNVTIQESGGVIHTIPGPGKLDWSPLGVRVDANGYLLVTDIFEAHQGIHILPISGFQGGAWQDFNPAGQLIGNNGGENGQFSFPNVAVRQAQGRIFVTDGNNSRISVWDNQGNFLFNFGRGTGDGAVNLPRGAMIDNKLRLYIVDAVGQTVRVYNIAGETPEFLFNFGDFGLGDGQFNYPIDIAIDQTGRLYVVDRENNRVQVWSY